MRFSLSLSQKVNIKRCDGHQPGTQIECDSNVYTFLLLRKRDRCAYRKLLNRHKCTLGTRFHKSNPIFLCSHVISRSYIFFYCIYRAEVLQDKRGCSLVEYTSHFNELHQIDLFFIIFICCFCFFFLVLAVPV